MELKEKFYLKEDKLIQSIKSKGINIKNEEIVKEIIKHNNYYYITGYKGLFKKSDSTYKKNIYFEDIYQIYEFDK